MTTDNGSNVISATNILKWQRLPCFGHCLNLAVTNSLKRDGRVARALGVARKIVSSFSMSWKKRRELAKIQLEKGLPQHNLVADCVTRWGSMEKMVSRILEQEEALRVVLSSDRKTTHLIPTWQDVHVFESITKALSTDFLSGDSHVTVSSIQPVLHNLGCRVLSEDGSDTPLTKEIKKGVLDYLQSKYLDPKVKVLLSIATFLDPRFKTDYISGVDLELLMDEVVDRGMEFIENQQQDQDQTSAADVPPPHKKKKLMTFLKKDQTDATSSALRSPLQKLKEEIEMYRFCPKFDVESDETPLQWWNVHESTYPVLSKLARKHLCLCATSCASERLFSTSGNIVTPTRATLKPHKVHMLVFLAKNL